MTLADFFVELKAHELYFIMLMNNDGLDDRGEKYSVSHLSLFCQILRRQKGSGLLTAIC